MLIEKMKKILLRQQVVPDPKLKEAIAVVKNSISTVALAFIPNPQDKPHINHIDGDKTHNCVWNLEWVTPKENTHHAIATKLRNDELRDLIGQKFGRLTVIEYVGKRRDKKEHVRNLWKCKCDCGKEHIVTDNNLITGAVKSCGCQKGHKKCVE